MKHIAEDGTALTDELLDKLAEEYESGAWKGDLGEVTRGRPKLCEEELETVSFRLPKSRIAAIEAVAKKRGQSKSEFLRQAVDRNLIEA